MLLIISIDYYGVIHLMNIQRKRYINKLDSFRGNGSIKVLTGLRRCGKTTVLTTLFHQHLIESGVKEEYIIELALDSLEFEELREKHALYDHIKTRIQQIRKNSNEMIYVFLDEIQFVEGFWEVINSLQRIKNIDIYVTGSNSKMLSTDIATEFRGRSTEIRIWPLMFSEFLPAYEERHPLMPHEKLYPGQYLFPGLDINAAWQEYYTYGGMPEVLEYDEDEKVNYLQNLYEKVYIKDIVERNKIKNVGVLRKLLDVLSSSDGSLTNILKISKTFKSSMGSASDDDLASVSYNTLSSYISCCEDAFLIEKAEQYNVKGRKYINSNNKYYFSDVGLRNARLNLRQQEETHLMENIIYNELLYRGYKVDIGVVNISETINEKRVKKNLEIDFVANKGSQRYYIQSAYAIPDRVKIDQEKRPLIKVNDSFKKIIIVKDQIKLKRDDDGIVTMSLFEFLLNENSIDM